MAIAFDAATNDSFTVGTSHTFSHTVTGSNPVLLVGVQGDNSTGADTGITGVTYNGVAMTLVDVVWRGVGKRACYLWRLAGPATGAHNVVISASSSVFIQGYSVSYTGVDQTTPIDSHNTTSGSSGTSLTASTTVVAANCWLVMFGQVDAGAQGQPTAGTGTTRRAQDTDFTSCGVFDSAGTVSTGSQSLQFTWSSTGGSVAAIASLTPVGGGGGGSVFGAPFFRQIAGSGGQL